MERLQSALFFDNVPDTWTKLAYPSTYCLAIWCVSVKSGVTVQTIWETYFRLKVKCIESLELPLCVRYNDMLQRCKELDSWTQDLSLPSVVWLSGLFNPQSFLTGNMHSCMLMEGHLVSTTMFSPLIPRLPWLCSSHADTST